MQSSENSSASHDTRRKTRPLMLLLVAISVAGVIGLILWMRLFPAEVTDGAANYAAFAGFKNSVHKLSQGFKDENRDLIADEPTDPSRWIDPPTLTFSFVAADDAAAVKEQWRPFTDYLSQATGKPVEYLLVTSTQDELEAMHDGKLQVACFNTGAVPPAVNLSGFVPVCALPTPDGGALTHTDILVPADSPLQKPEDLKGHELTLTNPTSNSGYKAPLLLLKEKFGLQPISDIRLRYSQSHGASIAGVVAHRYEAAAVSDDMLGRQLAAGTITPSQFRIIFKSESFPTAGLGYVYNLRPELARKVRQALLTFDWKGTPLEKSLSGGTQTKFVPTNYKEDWALVRMIDDEMGELSGF